MHTLDTYRALTAAAMLGLPAGLDAQIQYTDLDPDLDLEDTGGFGFDSVGLDLNMDGLDDLGILADYIGTYNGYCGAMGLNGAELAGKPSPEIFWCDGPRKSPFRAEADQPLDNTNLQWIHKGHLNRLTGGPCTIGFWDIGQTGFMGLRIPASSGYQYGWVRMHILDHAHVRILDYALNTAPDAPIRAGESPSCPLPSGLGATADATGTHFSWTASMEHDRFALELTRNSDSASRTFVLDSAALHTGSLDPSDTYTWTLRAQCSDGLISTTVDRGSLASLRIIGGEGVGLEDAPGLSLSPNPAKAMATIKGEAGAGPIVVYSVHGKVMTSCNGCTTLTADLQRWPNGVYLVQQGERVLRLYVVK